MKCNEILEAIKSIVELGRPPSEIFLSVIKSLEVRNLFLFFFDALIADLDDPEVIEIILMFAYYLRAVYMPDPVYHNYDKKEVSNLLDRFLHSHEETFGETNSSFCLHYLSHSAEEREYGDFTECSAFSPESAYGQLIRLKKLELHQKQNMPF